MEEMTFKYLLIGAATALVLFIALMATLCFCRRRRRRRVHMEKMTMESPGPSYKINLAGIGPIASLHHSKELYDYGSSVVSHSHIQSGFSQVFHGSPIMPHKNFEAPPPPISTSPYLFDSKLHSPYGGSIITEGPSLHSVIVIDGDKNNNAGGTAVGSPTSTIKSAKQAISPRSGPGERLSLKNRPFQLETVDAKVQKIEDVEIGRASSAASRRIALVQRDLLPKDSLPNENSAKLPIKMDKLQENENEMLYYEFDSVSRPPIQLNHERPPLSCAKTFEKIAPTISCRVDFFGLLVFMILAYVETYSDDFNRVRLKITPEHSNARMTDYINASNISTDNVSVRYIAAQGPIGSDESAGGHRTNTIADFWQMIWQEDVDTIVMLSDCVEDDKPKCAVYWPETAGAESLSVGINLFAELYCITEDDISFQREIFLQKEGEPKRRIIQWQYKFWRDSTNPTVAENLLTFMETVRSVERRSPILVHCGEGSGRTGVFISVDILLDKLQQESVINVFDTVARLCEQRSSLVKTGDQYLMIYEAIALAIRRRTPAH